MRLYFDASSLADRERAIVLPAEPAPTMTMFFLSSDFLDMVR